MDQIVEKALASLTITCNISSLHILDEDRIKVTLRTLNKNGVVIDIDEMKVWLTQNGWQSTPISKTVAWANSVVNGSRLRLNDKSTAPTETEIWQKLNA